MGGFFLPGENNDYVKKEVYNLKSQNNPPNNRLLDSFETDLSKLIKMVKFKKVRNNFQMKLNKDIEEVKTSKYIWGRSDKSKNIYKIKPSKYQEILKSKITNNYKIDYNNTIEQIDKDTSNFASRLQTEDRLGKKLIFYLRTINQILKINCKPDWLTPLKQS